MLDNEIDPLCLELTFSLDTDMFGKNEVIELKPGGSSIPVSDANKVSSQTSYTHINRRTRVSIQLLSH